MIDGRLFFNLLNFGLLDLSHLFWLRSLLHAATRLGVDIPLFQRLVGLATPQVDRQPVGEERSLAVRTLLQNFLVPLVVLLFQKIHIF